MKFNSPSRFTSFYESFSDLIFGTMAIFVLLFMIMATQVAPLAPQKPAPDMDTIVAPHRFTGETGQVRLYTAQALVNEVESFIWFPTDLATELTITRELGRNDPLKSLVRLAQSGDRLQSISGEQYVAMGSGLSRTLLNNVLSMGEGTDELQILREHFERSPGDRIQAPEKLRDQIFGPGCLHSSDAKLSQPALEIVGKMQAAHKNSHNLAGRYFKRARERAITDDGDAFLRFSIEGTETIRIGDARLNAAEFRAVLRAIVPGSNFYIEYVSNDGKPVKPPAWILEKVLKPTGFNRRILNETAI